MTNLPSGEREALAEGFALGEPGTARVSRSRDETVKPLWRMADSKLVESVLIPAGAFIRRLTRDPEPAVPPCASR